MPKITKRIVDALEPNEDGKEALLWDSEIKGFGVRVMPSGIKSYIIKYRTIEGRQRKMTIGRVGVLTAEQARNLAREKLTEAMTGGDPAAQRQEIRHSMTVAELCDEYLEHAKQRLKPNSYSSNESNIRIHIKPLIGTRAAAKLTVADVIKMQDDITDGKTAKHRTGRGGYSTGGIASASRTMTILGGVLEFGRLRGIVSENVTRGIRKQKPKARDRFLSDEEIIRLGGIIRASDHEGLVGLIAVQFLLLTGLRRNEALSLKWDWLDIKGGCIHFPDTKTGKQVRPIGKVAFEVISKTVERSLSLKNEQKSYVFPASKGDGHFIGLPKVLHRLCKAAAIEDVSLHTLRHTFASVAAGMGYSELTIAGLLGHSAQGITARYAHVADKALIGAADAVSGHIAKLLNEGVPNFGHTPYRTQ
ncbi:tyrosine-type recombinase/integrase [Bartonella apis]|uniref:tyrosine-type recombinase/integrase n=1 Tax=Bartonella apis TaxID=1686310 RepID=UPI0039977CCB